MLHTRRNDKTSQGIEASIRFTQLETGSNIPFFTRQYNKVQHLITKTWATHLWQFLDSCAICIENTDFWAPELTRENDKYIMMEFAKYYDDKEVLFRLNCCRLYLRTVTLADITTINGENILKDTKNLRQYRHSKWKWPKQQIPKEWWAIWENAIKLAFTNGFMKLRKSLGKWTNDTHQTWIWRINDDGTKIRNTILETNYIWNKTNHYILSETPTSGTIPCDINKLATMVVLQDKGKLCIRRTRDLMRNNLLDGSPLWMTRNWGIHNLDNEKARQIRDEASRQNIICVSDGSVWNKKGSHAYCIATKNDGNIIVEGQAPVDGDPETMNSFRTEAAGIMAITTMMNKIILPTQDSITTYKAATDSESFIKKTKHHIHHTSKNVFDPENDIMIELYKKTDLIYHV